MNSSEEFDDDSSSVVVEIKKIKKKVGVFLLTIASICILLFISLVGYTYYYYGYSMATLPKGEFITESNSPDGTYTLRAYRINGGATSPLLIRGELIFNKNNKRAKNIYWNKKENFAVITWNTNEMVTINNHPIKIPNGKYDFRR